MKGPKKNSSGPQFRKKKSAGKKRRPTVADRPKVEGPVRLNKYIAQSGVCARRKADELIRDGRVKVNNEVVTEMGIKVSPGDVVEVNGNRITPLSFDYVLLHKPTNVITTNSDDRSRKVVLDLIEDSQLKTKGLFPVGRLDRNTTGVLLITNDGELAHRLMHPRYEIEKLYVVKTKLALRTSELNKLREGIEIDGELFQVDEVAYSNLPKKNELGVRLHEGKNRHIRRMIEAIGHDVTRLKRVRYAGLTTEDVRPGKWRRLNTVEIKRLRRLVKLK